MFLTKCVRLDNRTVHIRQMDEGCIISGDMRKINQFGKYGICTADRPLDPYPSSPNRFFHRVHCLLLHHFGTGAFLAWDDNKIIGFINFHPDGLELPAKLCLQLDHPNLLKKLDTIQFNNSKITLRIRCVSLSPGYRNKKLGKTMVQMVTDWARTHDYKEIRVLCPKLDWTVPPRIFWEKLGFSAVFQKGDQIEMGKVI